jgi:HEAT repeat protein
VGAAILMIWGIRLLWTHEKNYKDLVDELETKTFGNRWVAAYELSKYLNSHALPREEHPWLISRLERVYDSASDPQTKQFVVLAVGALKNQQALPFFRKILEDIQNQHDEKSQKNGLEEESLAFHLLVSLGQLSSLLEDEKQAVGRDLSFFFKHADPSLRQMAIFSLVKIDQGHLSLLKSHKNSLLKLTEDVSYEVKMAAVCALGLMKEPAVIPLMRELLHQVKPPLPSSSSNLVVTSDQYYALQLNALTTIEQSKWTAFRQELDFLSQHSPSSPVQLRAREVFLKLREFH